MWGICVSLYTSQSSKITRGQACPSFRDTATGDTEGELHARVPTHYNPATEMQPPQPLALFNHTPHHLCLQMSPAVMCEPVIQRMLHLFLFYSCIGSSFTPWFGFMLALLQFFHFLFIYLLCVYMVIIVCS